MTIIDGKLTAQQLRTEIAAEVAEMVAAGQPAPHLVAILVGNNGASMTYVANKEKMCGECGFRSTVLRMPEETTEEQLLAEVERLNNDPEVDGFIVQLPLPKHIDEQRVIEAISPRKDVDGFTPINVGAMVLGVRSILSRCRWQPNTLVAYTRCEQLRHPGWPYRPIGTALQAATQQATNGRYLYIDTYRHEYGIAGRQIPSCSLFDQFD